MPKKIIRGGDTPRPVVNDPRFASMHSAPIFKKIQKDSNKIKVDERFKTVLTDDRFRAVPGAIDIYGRKNKKSAKSAAAEKELNSFYQIDESIAANDDEEEEKATSAQSEGKKGKPVKDTKNVDPESRLDYLNRLARGDVSGSSSEEESEDDADSDADSDDSDDEKLDIEVSGQRGPLDLASDEESEDDGEEAHATCRLALMNCDWDSLKAQDLMSVLQSFCPTGKTVEMVTVYPSDFGKEQMANEMIHGPPKIWTGGNQDSDEDQDIDDDSDDDDEEGDNDDDDDDDEGYAGIAAIDEVDAPAAVKKSDKWKRANNAKTGKLPTPAVDAKDDKKEKVSKSDRKGDFKRLPGTVGLVLQGDLVSRGLNRADDADGNEDENSEDEQENYFDSNLSKGENVIGKKCDKGKPVKGQVKKALERERFSGAGKGDEDGEGGFDEVALRAYELSKLKYYFAVAHVSSIEAAEALMAQLDGVELGHSSMVFDLRYIPEDTSFDGRDVRDTCTEVGTDYQPPDFVVNALQHTTVQCSWDEGEKDRERKLTNISQWRQLAESELLQYVASSGSDDDDEEEEEEEEEDSDNESDDGISGAKPSKASSQRKQSAANLRRLLLGAGSDDDSVDEDSEEDDSSFAGKGKKGGKGMKSSGVKPKGDDADKGFEDDFFMDDGEAECEAGDKEEEPVKAVKSLKSKQSKKADNDMTFTYIPDSKKDQKKDQEQHLDETPFEMMQRKLTEKRKARKAAKKLVKGGATLTENDEDEEEDVAPSKGKKSGKKGKADEEREAASKAELELLISDDDEGYDMRALHKQEVDAQKGAKGKRKSRSKKPKDADDAANDKDSTSASGGDFQLDLQDTRFGRLLEGDSSFGIDRTSSEFKETKAMKQIFGEQRKRREKGEADQERRGDQGEKQEKETTSNAVKDVDVNSLVSKLKRKYVEQATAKPKTQRL